MQGSGRRGWVVTSGALNFCIYCGKYIVIPYNYTCDEKYCTCGICGSVQAGPINWEYAIYKYDGQETATPIGGVAEPIVHWAKSTDDMDFPVEGESGHVASGQIYTRNAYGEQPSFGCLGSGVLTPEAEAAYRQQPDRFIKLPDYGITKQETWRDRPPLF